MSLTEKLEHRLDSIELSLRTLKCALNPSPYYVNLEHCVVVELLVLGRRTEIASFSIHPLEKFGRERSVTDAERFIEIYCQGHMQQCYDHLEVQKGLRDLAKPAEPATTE